MNLRADGFVVNAPDCCHGFRRKRWEVGSVTVVCDLFWPFAAGNGAGDGIEHENPAQGKLGHGIAGGQKGADLFYYFEPDIQIHSGKSLTYIKRCAVTIEVAVIISLELGIATEFASQKTAGQRHARQDANLLLFGLREEEFCRALAEAIEDDLHGLDIGEVDGFQSFLDLLHADAVIAE